MFIGKQTKEHIEKRVASFKRTISITPLPLKNIGVRLKTKIHIDTNGCWVWHGAMLKKKYGNYGILPVGRGKELKNKRAHRVSYEYFVGKIKDGLEIDHLCHNTLCINPKHLEAVTHAVNTKRRKDSNLPSCKRGHLYTKDTTTFHTKNGRRLCRTCARERARLYYLRNK